MSFRRKVAPGIEIRQFELHDAQTLLRAVEQDRAYLREWLPWVDHTQSVMDVMQFIERAARQFAEGRGPQAGIWVEGALRGSVGCHPIDWTNRNCSLGYWLESASQGRGIITRCCSSLLDYLFDDLQLHRVTIQCGIGNTKSGAIPARLAFQREGVIREAEWVNDRWVDLVVWGMLAEDWRRLRSTAPAS